MAKLKSKINSKYKATPKRKLVLGGLEDSPYLAKSTYQAQDAPTTMLQNQFDANEQRKAQQMTAIYGNQLARELDYLGDLNAASEKRKQEEQKQRDAQAAANKQTVTKQVSQVGVKTAKDAASAVKDGLFANSGTAFTNAALSSGSYYSPTWAPITPAPLPASLPTTYPTPILIDPAMQAAPITTGELFPGVPTVGQNLATTSSTTGSAIGQNLAALGKSAGSAALIAAPEIAGTIISNQVNELDDKKNKKAGRSQYYDDTEYSRKEYNAQLAKSIGRGATIGGTIASAIPIPGISTGIGMTIGAIGGLGAGLVKAQHQRRMTKEEDERGFKIGDKRFGKKLLFGEENVYDENLDPTVLEKRNRAAQLQAMTNTANAMENARMSSMTQSDLNTGFALKNSTFEAKYGGNIKYLKGGVAKSIGRGAVEYVGKKHEHGGIDLPGNIEVEGGETEQNDYVFSATLKLPNGETYAQAHKALIKSGAPGQVIHQLALSQEAAAGRNPNQIKSMKFAKYGGPLQYDKGGEKPTLKERRKERLLNKFNKEYDAQIQELEGLPEDQIADKVNEMYKAFIKREGQLNYDIEDQKTFDKTDLAIDLFANTLAGTLGGAAGLGIGAPVGAGIGLGIGTAKALKEYITSKRGTSRRLDKLEAQKAANINFENNLIYNPKGKLANKYVEAYLKENPYISNAKDFNYIEDTIYSPTEFDGYNLAITQAADNYFKSREEEKQAALKNPPVPIKGKDAGKLSRTTTPKLVPYNLPSINPGPTVTTFVPDEEPTAQNQVTAAIANSGLSTEEFAKQTGVDPELIKGIQAGTINLNPDEQAMLLAAIPNPPVVTANTTATNTPVTQTVTTNNPPVTTQTNNPPVTNTNTTMPNPNNNQPKENPTYNTYDMPYQYTAKTKGALDYSDRETAGGIWKGDRYEKEWKPLVSGTMSDAAKADKVISYLENYNGQDAADVKAKIAGKTREEKIAIINRLATDTKVGPFHNAVLQGINTTIEPPEPIKETTKDDDKTYVGNDLNEVVITGEREKLPPLPEYRDPNIGWVQAIPATMAMFSNIKPANYSPTLASRYTQPGAVGKVNLGRVSYKGELAANQANNAAMNQALQNMSGPGAVAGMLAAKTKADQQALQIAQAEQNTNMARAGEEAKINAGISQFNVGQAMQAQAENNRMGMYNAEMINKANAFNTTAKMQADMYNLETKLGAGEKVANTIIQSKKDADTLKATNRLANAMDYSKSLYRDDTFATLKKASQDPNNTDFYGKTDEELMNYARKYSKRMYGDMGNVVASANTEESKKFGGVKKYVSRLGDLKNNRYKV